MILHVLKLRFCLTDPALIVADFGIRSIDLVDVVLFFLMEFFELSL